VINDKQPADLQYQPVRLSENVMVGKFLRKNSKFGDKNSRFGDLGKNSKF